MDYTVDEVSDLLDIPRPTLYRYLREYSILHVRRSGKIYIPEESFEWIREARELHREGLGTESVRRRLRGADFDVEGLAERMDRLYRAVEGLQRNPQPVGGESSAQALQTILERQSLLISAVSNLAEKVDDLVESDRPRMVASSGPEEGKDGNQKNFSGQPERRTGTLEDRRAVSGSAMSSFPGSMESPGVTARRRRFGALAWRRRIFVLAVLLALLTSAVLAWATPALNPGETLARLVVSGQSAEEDPEVVSAADEDTQDVEVPNLVGLAALSDGKNELTEVGLKILVRDTAPSEEIPVGRVVAQDPPAGAGVDPGATVEVVVSNGPPEPRGANAGAVQYRNGEIQPEPLQR